MAAERTEDRGVGPVHAGLFGRCVRVTEVAVLVAGVAVLETEVAVLVAGARALPGRGDGMSFDFTRNIVLSVMTLSSFAACSAKTVAELQFLLDLALVSTALIMCCSSFFRALEMSGCVVLLHCSSVSGLTPDFFFLPKRRPPPSISAATFDIYSHRRKKESGEEIWPRKDPTAWTEMTAAIFDDAALALLIRQTVTEVVTEAVDLAREMVRPLLHAVLARRPAPAPPKRTLTLTNLRTKEVHVLKPYTTIGSHPDNDIVLSGPLGPGGAPEVLNRPSKLHAHIVGEALGDLGVEYGTWTHLHNGVTHESHTRWYKMNPKTTTNMQHGLEICFGGDPYPAPPFRLEHPDRYTERYPTDPKGNPKGKVWDMFRFDIVVEDDADDVDVCPICHEVPKTPVTLPCGHVGCSACFSKWVLNSANGASCPSCRRSMASK